jgi:hypothetical protein
MLTSTYLPLINETGEFIYSNYGAQHALLFRGDEKFRERTINLIRNFYYRNRKVHQFDDYTYYVLLEQNQILEMVENHLRAIISLSGECRDINGEIIESEQISLAKDRAMEWWLSKVKFDNLLSEQYNHMANSSKEIEYFE